MNDPSTRLEQAIARLGAALHPPSGWEARVLAAVEPRRESRFARSWLAISAAAAVLIAMLLLKWSPRPSEPLGLSAELVAGSQVMRGPSSLRVIARGGDGLRTIRIYRYGYELVAVCPGHPACEATSDELRIVLDSVLLGSYQIVVLSSSGVLPAATGSTDRDLATAVEAGARWKLHELEVR